MKFAAWIDPPNGHTYDFPKLYDSEVEDLPLGDDWLVENGMPDRYRGMGYRMIIEGVEVDGFGVCGS